LPGSEHKADEDEEKKRLRVEGATPTSLKFGEGDAVRMKDPDVVRPKGAENAISLAQVGQQAVTAFAKAVGESTIGRLAASVPKDDESMASATTLDADRREVQILQARLEALQSSNTTIMDELKAERMKVVELTADAAKYKAESAMKDKHIELLQVIRLQYREAALARSSARRPPPRGIVWSRVSRVSRPRGSR
jgi:hypothetical protein